MKSLRRMPGNSILVSICIVSVLIAALVSVPVITAGPSESGFHISQLNGEAWEEIYQHQFQVEYSTEAFTVDVVDGKVVLRIVQLVTPFADIDQISLMADGQEFTPEYARYTGSSQSILEDILELDHNVVIAHEQEIEVSWDVPAGSDIVTVYLTANEYGHFLPFHFPENGCVTYETGSNIGSITVDGLISETDGTAPLYSPFWRPDTGHPDGYTYIYICDDEQYVYFSLDVTMDNTNEYGEDWAEIRILQPDGSARAFRIDDFDNTWGEAGFGLTSKVSYKHQTYEFAIPKSYTGNGEIEFSLAYYGTAGTFYYLEADADVYPLVIETDGDSSSGQVFSVGDTISVAGYVRSMAYAGAYDAGYLLTAILYCHLRLDGPGNPGLEHDFYDDYNDNKDFPNNTYVEVFFDDSLLFIHTLTTPGAYTISLYSDAYASVSYLGGASISSVFDRVEETLSFTVVSGKTADLITDGGDNPTDVGDLNVSYASGNFVVEYFIDAPWEIVETHVYIGDVAPDNSAPGRFPYEAGEIEFTASGGSVYIAAHAEIRMDTGEVDEFDNPIYVYESVWAQTGTDFAIGKGANWATYFEYEIPD